MSLLEEYQTVGLSLNVGQSHAAVRNLQKIQCALADISDLVNAGKTVDSKTLDFILSEGEDGAENLSGLFSAVDPIYYNLRPTPKSASLAQKTFATTELLEMVLLNLSPWTLLSAQRTSRHFFKTLEGSSKLQQKMMLEQSNSLRLKTFAPEHHWRSHTFLGLSYKLRPPGIPFDDKLFNTFFDNTPMRKMELFVYIDPGNLPRIGTRCRRMLLCEPIVTRLIVYPGCCGALGDDEYSVLWRHGKDDSVHEISNPTGITIGDIYESARLVKEHPECGFRGVTFVGTVSVEPSDPTASSWLARCGPKTIYDDDGGLNDSYSAANFADEEVWEQVNEPEAEDVYEEEEEAEDEFDELVHGYDDAKEVGKL